MFAGCGVGAGFSVGIALGGGSVFPFLSWIAAADSKELGEREGTMRGRWKQRVGTGWHGTNLLLKPHNNILQIPQPRMRIPRTQTCGIRNKMARDLIPVIQRIIRDLAEHSHGHAEYVSAGLCCCGRGRGRGRSCHLLLVVGFGLSAEHICYAEEGAVDDELGTWDSNGSALNYLRGA